MRISSLKSALFIAGLSFLSASVLYAAPTEAPKSERKWWACSSDSECVITSGFCGEKDCVNKNWLTDYHHYTHEMDKNRDCVPVKERQPITPKCSKAKCICEKVLSDLPTPPKMDESKGN